MNHFEYRNGELHAEGVPLSKIAEQVGTPFYCYSSATFEHHYKVFAAALAGLDATICYATKANSNVAVLRTLARCGAGADIVSEGELRQALAAGIPADKIVFSGVGKTRAEMAFALKAGIMQLSVESEPELGALNEVALSLGMKARIAIRVNPDVDAGTHAKITTGKKENKFGIEWTRAHEVFRRANAMEGIDVVSVACHIGSQLTELEPYRNAFLRVRDLTAILRADGINITCLDLGGGLGIPYDQEIPPDPKAYADIVRETLGQMGCRFVFEPGRLIAGNAGVLVSRVIYVKEGSTRTFVIQDAAMNDLIRPAMYDAYHDIVTVAEPQQGGPRQLVDIVGPVCESSDTFGTQRSLTPVKSGDLLAIHSAGAYGAVMASSYNSRPLVPEVLVKGDAFAIVRKRPTYEEMLAQESLPSWLDEMPETERKAG